MKLKASYDNQADVPAQHAELFEERQGKWILVNIDGIDTEGNVHRLTTANGKLRTEMQEIKTRLQTFGDTKPEDIESLTNQLAETKAALALGAKPDEDKVNALVESRLKIQLGPLQKELATTKTVMDTITQEKDNLQNLIKRNTINESVRTAAVKAGVVPTAIDDIVTLGGLVFEVVDADGSGNMKVVTKDKIGVTPGLDPNAYFSEIGPLKPHWFPGSSGAGANGGKSNNGMAGGKNPWSSEGWSLAEQGRIVKEQGMDKANQIAKMAFSHVGATHAIKK